MAQGTSGRAPYGFRWQDGELTVVEAEAALRRLMCELFMGHQNKAGVAEALNAMGHYTRTGADWRDSTVGRLLLCASPIGTYFVNKTTTGPEGQRIDNPEDQWEAVPCPAIVDRSLWENVQALLREQIGPESKQLPSRAAHPLSGLVGCACGSPMQIPTELEKFVCTSCSTKISLADLEQIFLGDLHSFASKHTDALAGLLTAELPDDDLSREARNLEMEMEALEKQVAAAQQSVTSSLLTAAVSQHMESNESGSADEPEHVPGEPIYIRLPPQGRKCPDSGLTRAKLNELILATPRNDYTPLVKSINSCPPGKDRGVRLIIWASLKAYLKRRE